MTDAGKCAPDKGALLLPVCNSIDVVRAAVCQTLSLAGRSGIFIPKYDEADRFGSRAVWAKGRLGLWESRPGCALWLAG
ncbi:hypothetical protein [Sagittula marina]|uniref:hypothetical protein n=1 Tax=Sagittula marina TaxID=943940 RepID=UPI0031DE07D1